MPQGTLSGPKCFLLYINDLETHVPLFKYVDHSTLFEIYIIKEKLETWSSMESYLPTSDRHAASWIFSDGPSKPHGVVKLRYNALKLFFYNVAILRDCFRQ